MDYIEVALEVSPRSPGTDILIAALADIGFESFQETDNGVQAWIPAGDFSEEILTSLPELNSKDFKVMYAWTLVKDQNWNAMWESNFTPIHIAGKCCIRAPFHPRPADVEYDIIIQPKMSFGTGHHDTTALVMEKMLELSLKEKAVLDMGCGTGVLAILASMLGANPVTAIDTDEWAYLNTLENLDVNGVINVAVHKGDAQILEGKCFNVILANINRNVLLADISKYAKALQPEGHLVLSGFFETDVDALTLEANRNGFTFREKRARNTWALAHFIKN
jgi:ribosomal protein L11 methyltransferase